LNSAVAATLLSRSPAKPSPARSEVLQLVTQFPRMQAIWQNTVRWV
jgi:hypothetical protein